MNKMQVRACACPILSVLAVGLFIGGAAFLGREVRPADPSDGTVTDWSAFGLNRAVGAGRLVRDPAGALRFRASQARST